MWLVDDEEYTRSNPTPTPNPNPNPKPNPNQEYTSSTTADGGGINYLVLEEDEAPPPGVPWVGMADLHARGRQHLAQLERTRRDIGRYKEI